MRCIAAVLTGLMATTVAMAQAPPPPPGPPSGQPPMNMAPPPGPQPQGIPAEVQVSYARLKANIIKAATEMPPENYKYKPTPDIRTFARVVNHVTEAQLHICGAANATPMASLPTVPGETAEKPAILDALKASFAACDAAYAALNESNMGDMLQLGPVKRSRLGLMWGNVSHDNEQYATLALYMRLKGLTPPSSEK